MDLQQEIRIISQLGTYRSSIARPNAGSLAVYVAPQTWTGPPFGCLNFQGTSPGLELAVVRGAGTGVENVQFLSPAASVQPADIAFLDVLRMQLGLVAERSGGVEIQLSYARYGEVYGVWTLGRASQAQGIVRVALNSGWFQSLTGEYESLSSNDAVEFKAAEPILIGFLPYFHQAVQFALAQITDDQLRAFALGVELAATSLTLESSAERLLSSSEEGYHTIHNATGLYLTRVATSAPGGNTWFQ